MPNPDLEAALQILCLTSPADNYLKKNRSEKQP